MSTNTGETKIIGPAKKSVVALLNSFKRIHYDTYDIYKFTDGTYEVRSKKSNGFMVYDAAMQFLVTVAPTETGNKKTKTKTAGNKTAKAKKNTNVANVSNLAVKATDNLLDMNLAEFKWSTEHHTMVIPSLDVKPLVPVVNKHEYGALSSLSPECSPVPLLPIQVPVINLEETRTDNLVEDKLQEVSSETKLDDLAKQLAKYTDNLVALEKDTLRGKELDCFRKAMKIQADLIETLLQRTNALENKANTLENMINNSGSLQAAVSTLESLQTKVNTLESYFR